MSLWNNHRYTLTGRAQGVECMATSFPSHRDLFVHSAYGELDGQVVTITQDQIVECSTSDAKFCFSAVEDMDYKGDELKATFR